MTTDRTISNSGGLTLAEMVAFKILGWAKIEWTQGCLENEVRAEYRRGQTTVCFLIGDPQPRIRTDNGGLPLDSWPNLESWDTIYEIENALKNNPDGFFWNRYLNNLLGNTFKLENARPELVAHTILNTTKSERVSAALAAIMRSRRPNA